MILKKIGAVEDNLVHDFSQSSLPKTMIEFIELSDEGIKFARDIISSKKDSVDLKQRADNEFMIYHVRVN